MKPFFRWRTEEDETWEDESPLATAVSPHKFRLVFLFIACIIAGITFVYWQQVRQIQLEEAQIQADVLASHRTWTQAVANADFDLAVRLISSLDPVWKNTQRALFLQGLSLDRAPLGLFVQAGLGETAVTLTPDWQAAEVTFEQSYTAVTNNETTAIIQLKQTYLYQLDGSRWLQAPPDADFWGETLTYEGQWLTLLYPARDAAWAERLATDLDAELAAVCAANDCPSGVNVRLETDLTSLAALRDLLTPVFDGRFHTLPTFTLVGLPTDEASYQALYQGYTRRIITAFQNNLNLPITLPDQAIQTLCFPRGGNTPHLYRYDLATDGWTAELPARSFRFLSPLPDDSGVILSEMPASNEAARLRLSVWQSGQETLFFDDASRQWRFPPLGWGGQSQPPHLLLHEFDTASQTRTLYDWIAYDTCAELDCPVTDLPGYTVWSPDGRSTLIVMGSEIALGDGTGRPLQTLGSGSNPFWLDESRYGYMRYSPQIEMIATSIEDNSVQVLLTMADLTAVLADPDTGFPSINHIVPHPTIPGLLFLAGPEIRGSTGKYNIFSFQVGVKEGPIQLRLQMDEPPLGYPALLTPGGIPPISIGGNGRYLLATQLPKPPNDNWQIYLHDIAANQTHIINAGSPRYPANSPFYDWSKNGEWLVVVDDGFFKLIAPAASYERLILHDFDACYFTAWVNP